MFRDWATRSIQLEGMWPSSLAALSTTVIPHVTASDFTCRPAPYEHSRLLPADILCLVNTCKQLDLVWHTATAFDVFASLSIDEHTSCAPVRYVMYRRLVHDTGLLQNHRFDVLFGLEMLAQLNWESELADEEGKGVCALCASKLREKWETKREETWGKLDELFQLEELDVV
ncbi:hypothetical protein DFH08DRAFT_808433 [Mycena albidolilacea]|uniref:Uncharacterized protein n=1 Tax=Mycena albidolilacea TaxID=1033008 RepID=A0AAD7A4D5_9AGAR|nr:hypothetical protein DFH08DRAFT_808433 [Mycena albidolilacea]